MPVCYYVRLMCRELTTSLQQSIPSVRSFRCCRFAYADLPTYSGLFIALNHVSDSLQCIGLKSYSVVCK